MIIAPASWSLLPSATFVTGTGRFQRGFPRENIYDLDLGKPAILRGRMVVDSTSNKINVVDSSAGAVTATPASATYNSVAEWCIQIAAALNTATSLTTYYCVQLQGSTSRYRIKIGKTSGTFSILNGSGADAATAALVKVGGFGAYDRSSAASHTGDFAVVHGPSDQIELNLGASYTAEVGFIVPGWQSLTQRGLSQGAVVGISTGSTTPVSSASDVATTVAMEGHDTEVLFVRPTASPLHQYVGINITDPKREDAPRCSIAYAYWGPCFNSDRSTLPDRLAWEGSSYSRDLSIEATVSRSVAGHIHVSEHQPSERFEVGFLDAPGFGPELSPEVRRLLDALGTSSLAFVVLDPTDEPHRETRICRLAGDPTITRTEKQSTSGRFRVGLPFEVVQGIF